MLEYIGKRLIQIIPVLLIVSFLIVSITRMVPGDPVRNILARKPTWNSMKNCGKSSAWISPY